MSDHDQVSEAAQPLVAEVDDPRDWGHTDYNGVFFNTWTKLPVYHGYFFGRRVERQEDVSSDVTRCGLVVSSYNRATGKLTEPGQALPLRHAVKFARPCMKCFPLPPSGEQEQAQ